LGYKQINKYLNGVYTKEEAINLIKIETWRYAKRQMTWFKNKIKNIEWIDLDKDSENKAISKIKNKIDNKCRDSIPFISSPLRGED
jgi:tRNA dimethylallyltransferase